MYADDTTLYANLEDYASSELDINFDKKKALFHLVQLNVHKKIYCSRYRE